MAFDTAAYLRGQSAAHDVQEQDDSSLVQVAIFRTHTTDFNNDAFVMGFIDGMTD